MKNNIYIYILHSLHPLHCLHSLHSLHSSLPKDAKDAKDARMQWEKRLHPSFCWWKNTPTPTPRGASNASRTPPPGLPCWICVKDWQAENAKFIEKVLKNSLE
jgi:hypothetical protein